MKINKVKNNPTARRKRLSENSLLIYLLNKQMFLEYLPCFFKHNPMHWRYSKTDISPVLRELTQYILLKMITILKIILVFYKYQCLYLVG